MEINNIKNMASVDKQVKPQSTGKGSKFIKILLLLVFIVAIGADIYFYKQLQVAKHDPQVVAQEETAELVAKVGLLIVLPEGETPTVATVNEPEKLAEQPFFSKAQKGDKVLIYTNAKKAILYSPTTNKIIEVAPLNIGDSQAASAVTPTTETPATTEGN